MKIKITDARFGLCFVDEEIITINENKKGRFHVYYSNGNRWSGKNGYSSIECALRAIGNHYRYKIIKENDMTNEVKNIYTKEMLDNMGIERVIFNDRATIVLLKDGTKGVSVCSKDDHNDPLVGLSVAYALAKGTKGHKKSFKANCAKLYKHNRQ